MHELKFKNPVFHKGINYTVRNGSMWYRRLVDEASVLRSDVLIDGIEIKVVDVLMCKYRDIPAFVLEYEHDPDCRNFAGLSKAMQCAYPNWTGNPQKIVTCIGFEVK